MNLIDRWIWAASISTNINTLWTLHAYCQGWQLRQPQRPGHNLVAPPLGRSPSLPSSPSHQSAVHISNGQKVSIACWIITQLYSKVPPNFIVLAVEFLPVLQCGPLGFLWHKISEQRIQSPHSPSVSFFPLVPRWPEYHPSCKGQA